MPYTKGSRKAMAVMKKRYGKRWKSVFYGKAMKSGKGKTPHSRANSVYTKGRKARKPRKSRKSNS